MKELDGYSNGELGKEIPLPNGSTTAQQCLATVILLVDCSGSMTGQKIIQAQQGTLDFAKTAMAKGYMVGLVEFDSEARLLCHPASDYLLISNLAGKFRASGSTNMNDALEIAFKELSEIKGNRVIVVATDGCPDDAPSALRIAERIKRENIEILSISTYDAEQDFLSKLVSRNDLNLVVKDNQLIEGLNKAADILQIGWSK